MRKFLISKILYYLFPLIFFIVALKLLITTSMNIMNIWAEVLVIIVGTLFFAFLGMIVGIFIEVIINEN